MPSPWDKDQKTVVIKESEVTQVGEGPALFKKTSKVVEKTPAGGSPIEEIEAAIDATITKLDNEPSDLSRLLEASEITSPRGISIGDILSSTTKLTQEQLAEALDIRRQQGPNSELL